MPSYDLRYNYLTADQLLKVLQAGNNISINKIDDCTVEISSTGGGTSNGTKYHLKNGDNITVQDCFQYYLYCNFILDSGSSFTIDSGGQLVVQDGTITNDTTIVNNGIIKNIC